MELKGRSLKVFNRYKEKYPDESLLKQVIISYVNGFNKYHNTWKYIDWLLKIVLNHLETSTNVILKPEHIIEQIKFFHVNNNLYNKKNLNGLELLSNISIKQSFNDINQYNFEQLKTANELVKKIKKDREEKIKQQKDVNIVYEDDDYLILVPLSWESSKFWGISTKWCTTLKNDDSYFKKYTENGSLFYIIDKHKKDDKDNPFSKFAIHLWDNQQHPDDAQVFNTLDDELKNGMNRYLPKRITRRLMDYHLNGGVDIHMLKLVIFGVVELMLDEKEVELGDYSWKVIEKTKECFIRLKTDSFKNYTILFDFEKYNYQQDIFTLPISIINMKQQQQVVQDCINIALPKGKTLDYYFKTEVPEHAIKTIELLVKTNLDKIINNHMIQLINHVIEDEINEINKKSNWKFKTSVSFTDIRRSKYLNYTVISISFTTNDRQSPYYGYDLSGGINFTQNMFYLNAGATIDCDWEYHQKGFIQLYLTEDGYRKLLREFIEWCLVTLIQQSSKKINDIYEDNVDKLNKIQKKNIDQILLDDDFFELG